jgi:site-specific DNA-cytosine methylase
MENVRGLLSVNGGRDWRMVLRKLAELGCYYVDWRVLNTAEHGVPQNRPRLYIVCIRDDCYRSGAFKWPEPIACPSVERFLDQRGPKPTLRTLQPPPQPRAAESWAAQMAKLWRDGEEPLTRTWLWDAGASEQRSSPMFDRCPCLMRTDHDIWISSHGRTLNLRERCRLQGSNPDKINVPVSDHQWRMQLGNSMSINVLERLLSRLLPAAGLTSALPDRWASGAAQRELEETVRND